MRNRKDAVIRVGSSEKYKYVYHIKINGVNLWRAELPQHRWGKIFNFDQEKEAAKAVDLKLIELKREPVNVLTKKQ